MSSTKPPLSSRSCVNGTKYRSNSTRKGSVQGGRSQKSRPISSLNPGGGVCSLKTPQSPGGKTPVAPGNQTATPKNSSTYTKTRNSSRASSTGLEQRQDFSTSSRQTFYVRVCLGHLTGLKIDALKRRRNKSNNIVVGYAALAKSGKRLALSQPVGPTFDDGSQKQLKLFWTNPRGEASISSTPSKRKLRFSLKLEKEIDRGSRAEDDALTSDLDFNPEVVKIIVGLKCGQEKFPLGIANLVINGKESRDQKVDLALRPMNDLSAAEMTEYEQKARVGFFGKKLQEISFKSHDQQYRLASNATVSIRMDVKCGMPGESTSIWGDEDDASYTTNFTFDTGSFPGIQRLPSIVAHGDSVSLDRQGRQRTENVDSSNNQNANPRNPIKKASRDQRPLKYVVVEARRDALSVASSLTSPSLGLWSWLCLQLCGVEVDATLGRRNPTNRASSFSFEDDLPSWNDIPSDRDESTPVQPFEDEPAYGEERSKASVESLGIAGQGAASKSRYQAGPEETHEQSHSEIADVEMYDDLKDAEATLLRY
jgi:hypothetical protein